MLPLIVLLVLAVAVSAFFTAAEAALFSLTETRVRTLVEEGRRGSRALQRLRGAPERTLIMLRLGDVMADVAAAITAGTWPSRWWGWRSRRWWRPGRC